MQMLELVLQILALVGVVAIVYLVRQGLPAYVSEKGKNLATKEDIEDITRKVENVKTELSGISAVEEQKRKLKYDACLDALSVIDAHFSQLFAALKPTPQAVSTVRVREAHTKLILSCNDIRIVEKFGELTFGPRPGEPQRPPTDLLNEFRNLIRAELGFGQELPLDRDRAWVGRAAGDPDAPPIDDPLTPDPSGGPSAAVQPEH
jgi:hypothetical protein